MSKSQTNTPEDDLLFHAYALVGPELALAMTRKSSMAKNERGQL